MKLRARLLSGDGLAAFGIVLLLLYVSFPGMRSRDIDTPDSGMHLMDGYFIHDMLHDHPHVHIHGYILDYYRQYPALGLMFWPPLFSVVLGVFSFLVGPHVLAGRICILFFGGVFSLSFYTILRRRFPPLLSFAATAAAVMTPGIAWSFNEIMLELPALAMMCVAILAYHHLVDSVDRGQPSTARALLCAAACAAVIYTKQPAWFLYAALFADFLALHRRHLSNPQVWITVGATAAFCLPLLIFTLTYGHANLAQSVGSNTKLIMSGYESLPRWSIGAWMFYPRLAVSSLSPVVLLAGLCALILAVTRPHFLQANALWVAWFLLAYVTFSFYDNRQSRFSIFWWPSWVFLSAACFQAVISKISTRGAWLVPLLLLAPLPREMQHSWGTRYAEFSQERPAIAHLFAHGRPGNILLFGKDMQVFIALIRENDTARGTHAIRGNRALKDGRGIEAVCRMYRIGVVLVELRGTEPVAQQGALSDLNNSRSFGLVDDNTFFRAGVPYRIVTYRYLGPFDMQMAEIPLSSTAL
jgi:hypothetical protein